MQNKKSSTKTIQIVSTILFLIALIAAVFILSGNNEAQELAQGGNNMEKQHHATDTGQSFRLPDPDTKGQISVETTIAERRSRRQYKDRAIRLEDVSQLLWAAQGITSPRRGFRAAPSAGALYPLETYILIRKAEKVSPGIYKYIPEEHSIVLHKSGDFSEELKKAALGQGSVSDAPALIILTAVYSRTTKTYRDRGKRYVHMEAGHVSENIYLQAEALQMGTVAIGAFNDKDVTDCLDIPEQEAPLYLMPAGYVE